ncbi:M20/M25/M40 family metallo-hydrolase [Cellulophaga baltica]|uniref:M20/M25/M40 family metallo-hydrolase n=1 Tax=Cellulophaga TaxID=104264 RepID=UPI001C07CBAB|nr:MULTISPECIES: M20/M25/M40 family metallo-hydrolase [Cellulophaga]MBU2996874.1 M20/M25/M40 family metallo-hydrolase [Cellulophaga baltica]MDO6768271.1 M20/M25/M40 family metallo-hydrolase [Cellulophaga sp. 1_MG-2023]
MKRLLSLVTFFIISSAISQNTDEAQLKSIYDTALTNGKGYDWLNHLSNQIGGRLSGSVQAQQAVDYTKSQLETLVGLDRVWLQPVMVPKWTRGLPEFAYFETEPGITTNVPICALGGSVSTPSIGIKTKVVEVKSLDDLAILGKQRLEGNIVFFNRPMDATEITTFTAYSGCVDQRYSGAAEAAKYGAVGVIVRSMNLRQDDFPHTGSMSYGDTPVKDRIPAAAISTNAADLLSISLSLNPDIKFYFKQNCQQYNDVQSYNVIGEIKGTTNPDEIIVVGGHLDSWDLGDGSHDDGVGCVQSMEVLRLLKETGYKPKRTLRVVLFMNEENGLRGGNKYAEVAKNKNEKHIFALESDAGGFSPRGFTFNCTDANFEKVQSWKSLFEPYLIHLFDRGFSGADIRPLNNDKMVLAGLRPDSQRYFDHHHAANDTFEHVNKRELQLGAATMASLVYLFDNYGIEEN